MKLKALYQKRADLAAKKKDALVNAQNALQAAHAAPEDQKEEMKKKAVEAKSAVENINAEIEDNEEAISLAEQIQEMERNEPAPAGGAQHVRDRIEDKPWENLGEFAAAVKKATAEHVVDPRLSPQAASGANVAVPSEGGFLLPEPMANVLLSKMHDEGRVLQDCDQMVLSGPGNSMTWPTIDETSRANGSRMGGVQAYWGNEGGSITASKAGLGQMRMDLNKVFALMYVTDEMLEDAGAMMSMILNKVPSELVFKAEDAIINGDGAGKPKGILAQAGNDPLVSVAKETSQKAATILYKNIVKMWARCWSRSLPRAKWYINQQVYGQLPLMAVEVGTGGSAVFTPPNGAADAPYGRLMGRPIEVIEYCAALGTIGDIILADMKEYQVLTKGGVKQAQSMHVKFTTEEQAFRWSWRINGQPKWDSALTPFKGSDTLSPFVALATRS